MTGIHGKTSVRVLQEAFGAGRLEVIDECVSETVIDHAAIPGTPPGRNGLKATVGIVRGAVPDAAFRIVHVVEEGDIAVVHWTMEGTNSGSFMGMPPSGARITMSGIEIDRYEDGLIVEIWEQRDMLGFLTQVGALPAM